MLNRGRLGVLFCCLALVVGSLLFGETSSAAPIQLAQASYPPPPPTPSPTPTPVPSPTRAPRPTPPEKSPKAKRKGSCVWTGTKSGNTFDQSTHFTPGEQVWIRGAKDCAKPGAQVVVYFDPKGPGKVIATTHAGSEGSYSVSGFIPRGATNGKHVIQSQTASDKYSVTVEISGGRNRNAGLLGSTRGLVGMGIVLALLALAVILAPRRRGSRLLQISGETSDVPLLDTSTFVPRITMDPKTVRKRKAPRKRPENA